MEKINFEDATLKKSAYVTIGGVEYPVTDAEYVGGTDLDAATLNYAFKLMHPVGSIYMTTIETNPSEIFGFGTWELWGAGRVPVGVDTTQSEFNTIEKTGGTQQLNAIEVGGSQPHDNLQPYITCYMFKRTA